MTIRTLSRVMSQFEDSAMSQLDKMVQLETAMDALRDSVVGLAKRMVEMNERISAISSDVNALKPALKAMGNTLQGHTEHVLNGVRQALDPSKDFGTVKEELGVLKQELDRLSPLLAGQKGHSNAIARLNLSASTSAKALEQNSNKVQELIVGLSDKLHELGKVSDKPIDGIGDLLTAIRSEKRIVRDADGNIVGWKAVS